MNRVFPHISRRHASWLRALPLLALMACAWVLPGQAMADNTCWISDNTPLVFGSAGPAGATTNATLRFTCQNDGPAVRTFRVCLYMNPDDPTGVSPRRMIHYGSGNHLNYDAYSDPAMTQLIGSTTSGHATYSTTLTTNATGASSGTMPIYARIPAGQNVTAGDYAGHVTDIMRTITQSGSGTPTVAQCATAPATSSNYTFASANFANACYVSTATDLNFGSATNLSTERNQTSTISLRCPNNTNWRVALNYGANATGTTRRMIGPGSSYITYQLFQDAARTVTWGNTTSTDVPGTGTNATQTLTVYGRVPAQPVVSAGAYSDTVTITLTY